MTDIRESFEDDSAENIIARLREAFKEEAYELLADMEAALLELEKNPGDSELIGRVFRAMHTIKGSGGACELQIMSLFDAVYRGGTVDEARGKEILALFKKLHPGSNETPAPAPKPAAEAAVQGNNVTYRIRFKPGPGILEQGADPLALLDEVRQLGPCEIVAHTDTVPFLEDYRPSACYTYWDIILTTRLGKNAIEDVFIFVKDTSEITIDVIDEEGPSDFDARTHKKLGEILLERGDVAPEDLQKALRSMKKIGEALMETGAVTPDKVESALVEQQHVREMREKRQTVETPPPPAPAQRSRPWPSRCRRR